MTSTDEMSKSRDDDICPVCAAWTVRVAKELKSMYCSSGDRVGKAVVAMVTGEDVVEL